MSNLPKQWKYWCKTNGLPVGRGKWKKFYLYNKKTNRHYRVNNLGMFQICDGNMDRWSNSVGAEVPLPKTELEFKNALKELNNENN